MNDKKNQDRRIILPDQDGVANLDIRRMKGELEVKPESREMCGYMPADLVPKVVAELKQAIEEVEKGEISSICVLAIMPHGSFIEAGKAFFSATDTDMDKIHELFHVGWLERLGEEPPDDEAG